MLHILQKGSNPTLLDTKRTEEENSGEVKIRAANAEVKRAEGSRLSWLD